MGAFKSGYQFPRCLRDYLDPRHYIGALNHCYQRVVHGVSFRDIWGLDYSLGRMLLVALPNYKNGLPGVYATHVLEEDRALFEQEAYCQDPAELDRLDDQIQVAKRRWDQALDEIMRVFRKHYGDIDVSPEEIYSPEAREELRRAWRMIADNIDYLWV